MSSSVAYVRTTGPSDLVILSGEFVSLPGLAEGAGVGMLNMLSKIWSLSWNNSCGSFEGASPAPGFIMAKTLSENFTLLGHKSAE